MIARTPWAIVLTLSLPCFAAQAADKPVGQTIDVNGVKVWYSVQGQGEPVVLVHGWLSSSAMNWDLPGISSRLAKDFQVVLIDVRGHGHSDKPETEASYGTELVEDIVRVLDQLQIKKAHVVGYSMGGIIVGNFIAKHPDRVLSGTLGGMGWLKEGGAGQWMFSRIGRNDPDAKARAICGRSLADLALTEEQIKSIKVPMTILVGDRDNVVKRLYVEPVRQARPDWTVVEINDAGHLNCIAKPEFQEAMVHWLKANASRVK